MDGLVDRLEEFKSGELIERVGGLGLTNLDSSRSLCLLPVDCHNSKRIRQPEDIPLGQ